MSLAPNTVLRLERMLGSTSAASDIARHADYPQFFGKTFYVCSVATASGVAGSNSYTGLTPDQPLATIDYAIGLCTANAGDRIFVLPGHVESLAADVDVDVAGISILGFGVGETRPVLTFVTAVAAKIDVDAANCRIANLVLKNDIASQVVVVDVDGAGVVLENLELLEGSSKQFLVGIDLGADRPTVRGCYVKSVAAGANSGIKISAAIDRALIEDCLVLGDFADAAIHNPTSAVATNLLIRNSTLTNLQSGDHAIELVSACTGSIVRNTVNSTLAAVGTKGAIDPGSCYCIENYGSDGVGDVSGVINPAADS